MASGGNRGAHVSARIAVGPGAVAEALTAARDFVRAYGAGEDLEWRLSIIVEELVMNLVDHGACPEGDVIGLTLRAGEGGTRMTLTDGGLPFDLRTIERGEDLPPERGGGAGIAMVLAWSRIEGYVRASGRNRLELLVPDAG